MVAEENPGFTPAPPQRHRREKSDGLSSFADDHAGKSPKTQRNKRPIDMAAKLRASKALALRDEGMTLENIAAALGYASRGAAHNAIDRELDRIVEHNATNLRKRENRKLDRLEEKILAIALSNSPQALWATDREIALMARRHKLNGLDADRDEMLAAMPYQKRIVLEDQPSVPAIGEVVE